MKSKDLDMKELLIKSLIDGKSTIELAKEYGVAKTTVATLLSEERRKFVRKNSEQLKFLIRNGE